MTQLDDQAQTRLALAALFAALVKSLDAQGLCAPSGFSDALDEIYAQMREYENPPSGTLDALRWTRELLKLS